jgi:2-oxoglutarate/2-oxoacid ferredoxin oxidoreductase subunit beta
MNLGRLKTEVRPEWCPGCGNYGILSNFINVLEDLLTEGLEKEKIVLVSGIGNHGKIVDYVNANSFYSLHGRAVPVAQAIKLANPDLKVICFVGDGDSYAEGLDHLIFAAKRNSDITVLVHDNRTYGLATGQFTPTSPVNYKGPTVPYGVKEIPFNPLELMLASGATFIGRAYPPHQQHFQTMLKAAIMHRGFALLDILQVCVFYNNLYEFYNQHVYETKSVDPSSFAEAWQLIRDWDYNSEAPIAVGTFYQAEKTTFEEYYPRLTPLQPIRRISVEEALARFV